MKMETQDKQLEVLTTEQRQLRPFAKQLYSEMDELCINHGLRRPWAELTNGDAVVFFISHPMINEEQEYPAIYVSFSGLEITKAPDIKELALRKFLVAKEQIDDFIRDKWRCNGNAETK